MKKYYPYIDLLKYISCIGIVCIHTEPFHYMSGIDDFFNKFQPSFVAIFFIVSSALFWEKIHWKHEDSQVFRHFAKRLLILLLLWGILLTAHWLPKFIRHNPDNWEILLLPKVLIQGLTQGSWFIVSLLYGITICYFLNRYLNRHLVFFSCVMIWLYFSFVHYEGMSDFLNIYWGEDGDGFKFESYCSAIRALVWIEAGFYLIPKIVNRISFRNILLISILSFLSLVFIDKVYFLFMTAVAIFTSAMAMTITSSEKNEKLIVLRKMSIIIFFSHFPIVTVFHMCYLKGIIPYEYGLIEFLITFAIVSIIAYLIIALSKKYHYLSYLY